MAPKTKAAKEAEPTNLPKIDRAMCERIKNYIADHYGSRRPPKHTAAILATLVEMHRRAMPFPDRKLLAKHVGCSEWGLDNCINTSMLRNLVVIQVETAPGNVSSRESIVQVKYVRPTTALMRIAEGDGREVRAA